MAWWTSYIKGWIDRGNGRVCACWRIQRPRLIVLSTSFFFRSLLRPLLVLIILHRACFSFSSALCEGLADVSRIPFYITLHFHLLLSSFFPFFTHLAPLASPRVKHQAPTAPPLQCAVGNTALASALLSLGSRDGKRTWILKNDRHSRRWSLVDSS